MDELEQLFRDSFERHAQEVDTAIAVPATRTARRWVMPLAAAAAVVVVATGAVMIANDGPESGAEPQPAVPVPADWRAEQWRGVQVSVPPEWGWGGAPMPDSFSGREGQPTNLLISCVATAFVDASGTKLPNGDPALPYVGRPMYMTDVCMGYDPAHPPKPAAPYVWLGAPIQEGTRDLGGGWTQETIEVAGESVTVATDDESMRRRILASAQANDETRCPTTTEGVWPRAEGRLTSAPVRMDVCAYVLGDDERELVYSTTVGASAAAKFLEEVVAAPTRTCIDSYNDEWVALRVRGADGETQVFVASLRDCVGIDDGKDLRELTLRNVDPWAVDGIAAYLTGPGEPRLSQYFRGMLG